MFVTCAVTSRGSVGHSSPAASRDSRVWTRPAEASACGTPGGKDRDSVLEIISESFCGQFGDLLANSFVSYSVDSFVDSVVISCVNFFCDCCI